MLIRRQSVSHSFIFIASAKNLLESVIYLRICMIKLESYAQFRASQLTHAICQNLMKILRAHIRSKMLFGLLEITEFFFLNIFKIPIRDLPMSHFGYKSSKILTKLSKASTSTNKYLILTKSFCPNFKTNNFEVSSISSIHFKVIKLQLLKKLIQKLIGIVLSLLY